MDSVNVQPLVQLRYSIVEASSFSGSYEPQNILYDRPHDIKSRWTGAAVAAMSAATAGAAGGSGTASATSSSTAVQTTTGSGGDASNNFAATAATRDGGVGGYPGRTANGNGTIKSTSATSGTSSNATEKQYIIMKLDKLSILRKIHFGKFYKAHPCNLKDFKVYGSASTRDPNSKAWVRILRGGLKNDSVPEVFDTRWTTSDGVPFPVRYVKLVPLATHIPNYNFSVWFVALEGISDPPVVAQISSAFHQHRESTAIRLILKHLRSRAYHSAFQVLLESSKLDPQSLTSDSSPVIPHAATGAKRPFEQPIVTQLFHALMQGSWDVAEQCLERAAWGDSARQGSLSASIGPDSGDTDATNADMMGGTSTASSSAASLLSSYIDRSLPKPVWTHIRATNEDGESPCGRGGHQMELDSEKGILWLFGGWSGTRDLSDLWAYYIREGRWRCISHDVRLQGGPGPRSCHKMVFDPRTGFLYVLGKYVDYDKAPSSASGTPSASSSYRDPSATSTSNDRHANTGGESTPSAASRGRFIPLFPGLASAAEAANNGGGTGSGSAARTGLDDQGYNDVMRDELFASNRGGHMRLGASARGGAESTSMFGSQLEAGGSNDLHHPHYLHTQSQHHSRSGTPTTTGYESDFYRFSTRSERWDRLSANTYAEGGPKLVFDHQMLIDPETQLLFVFGGRVAHPDANKIELSGMWKYDVIQRSWTFLFDDHHTHPQSRIPSRVGHTMLLDTPKRGTMAGKRVIWVLAGQRGTTYLADMWTYQLNTGAVREVSRDYSLASSGGGPEGGFTQRAVIGSAAREIYLFSGLVRRSKSRGERVKSAFWIYNIERNDWKMVYQHGGIGSALGRDAIEGHSNDEGDDEFIGNRNGDSEDLIDASEIQEPGRGPTQAFPVITSDVGSEGTAGSGAHDRLDDSMLYPDSAPLSSSRMASPLLDSRTSGIEPRPRFAAQMVFDVKHGGLFYIFGGNPAENAQPSVRLDDLWSLELVRPSVAEVLRRAKFKLRQQRFLEMAHDLDGTFGGGGLGAMQALMYLQTQVSQVVNHDAAEESQAFRKLMSHLLHAGGNASDTGGQTNTTKSQEGADGGTSFYSSSSPWMSPMPGHSAADSEAGGTFSSPLLRHEDAPAFGNAASTHQDSRAAVGGSQSGSDGDSEMLSVSQTLSAPGARGATATSNQVGGAGKQTPATLAVLNSGPPTLSSAGASSLRSSRTHSAATEGRPSMLYRQRYHLFRALCDFFPSHAVEPNVDLLDCIEISKVTI